jgi:GntR family transcriptional regulator
METTFSDNQPIYRQLRDRVIALVLDGVLNEGDPLPSVRQVAADLRVNPLTVLKSYQELADTGLVEKRRGMGMYVSAGARAALMARERERFLAHEWPKVRASIARLGLTPAELWEQPAAAAGGEE